MFEQIFQLLLHTIILYIEKVNNIRTKEQPDQNKNLFLIVYNVVLVLLTRDLIFGGKNIFKYRTFHMKKAD